MQFGELKRREFITLLGGAAAWPVAARSEQVGVVKRLAILDDGREADRGSDIAVFRQGLERGGGPKDARFEQQCDGVTAGPIAFAGQRQNL